VSLDSTEPCSLPSGSIKQNHTILSDSFVTMNLSTQRYDARFTGGDSDARAQSKARRLTILRLNIRGSVDVGCNTGTYDEERMKAKNEPSLSIDQR
jgi:hypothetical protein